MSTRKEQLAKMQEDYIKSLQPKLSAPKPVYIKGNGGLIVEYAKRKYVTRLQNRIAGLKSWRVKPQLQAWQEHYKPFALAYLLYAAVSFIASTISAGTCLTFTGFMLCWH